MSTTSYRDFTEDAAVSYQRYFEPTIATSVSAALLATADLRAAERVVDVACGTGLIARLAAERVGPDGAVSGVDLAPDMIEVARATRAPAAPAIDWLVRDATSLPFDDECFDVALCQMGLMFMEDRVGAVREMRRVLVPGGRVVVNTPGRIQPVFESMERAIVAHVDPDIGGFLRVVFSMHEPQAVGTLLREAGLADVDAVESPATFRLPPPAEFFWQYLSLTPIAPLVAQAPDDAKVAMERQVVEEWQPFVRDGHTVVEQPMVVAHGRR